MRYQRSERPKLSHLAARHSRPEAGIRRLPPSLWAFLVTSLTVALQTPLFAAGLLVADGGFGGQLEIEEQRVRVTINNGIAVTEVDQTFRNLEDRQVEALYTFPVPKGASVANFSMWIGGKEMVGEVLEKKRAREIYDSYKEVRRDPGLLEQVDFKTFEMRIFPIAPRAEQRVQITYYQELQVDDHWATYVYPLATVAHEGRSSRTRGTFSLDLETLSEIPIAEMDTPSHSTDMVIVGHEPGYWQASLEVEEGDLNRDVVLAYRLERPMTGLDLVASRQNGEDGYFLLTLTTGQDLEGQVEGSDYVFVLDISGSMKEGGKLGLSQRSIEAFIDVLGPEDRFDLITFNVSAESLFEELMPVTESARSQASSFLRSRQARGGTLLGQAVREAFRHQAPDRPLNVVILSDGMTDQGERSTLLTLAQERPSGARLFAVGVGNEVNRPLLEQLAEDAGGLAAFVSRGADFERQAQAFRRKLVRPAATEVEIAFEGGEVYDLAPGGLPNLYHGVPLRLYGRYRRAEPVRVVLRANVAGQPIERSVEMDLPKQGLNSEVERMWAFERIDHLLKDADRRGSRQGVLDEVVRLGEAFSIVTEYTSFIVLENDAEYQRWQIERRNALRLERDRAGQRRLRERLDNLRRQSPRDIGPGVPSGGGSDKKALQPGERLQPVPTSESPSRVADRQTQPPVGERQNADLSFGGGAYGPWSLLGLLALLAMTRLGKRD